MYCQAEPESGQATLICYIHREKAALNVRLVVPESAQCLKATVQLLNKLIRNDSVESVGYNTNSNKILKSFESNLTSARKDAITRERTILSSKMANCKSSAQLWTKKSMKLSHNFRPVRQNRIVRSELSSAKNSEDRINVLNRRKIDLYKS